MTDWGPSFVAARFDPRPLLRTERAIVVDLLGGLDEAQWARPTVCGSWDVKDVALHVLDGDLGCLSRGRDQDRSSFIPVDVDHREFVARLDEKNDRWVAGARGSSPRVVVDLLAWAGEQVDAHWATLDLDAPSDVLWAGPAPVPMWLDLGRQLTERWVHQQQIREAAGVALLDDGALTAAVLHTFAFALPHHYRDVPADEGDSLLVSITGSGGADWTLTSVAGGWQLATGRDARTPPTATVTLAADDAWRLFTGAPAAPTPSTTGPRHLTDPFASVRAIII